MVIASAMVVTFTTVFLNWKDTRQLALMRCLKEEILPTNGMSMAILPVMLILLDKILNQEKPSNASVMILDMRIWSVFRNKLHTGNKPCRCKPYHTSTKPHGVLHTLHTLLHLLIHDHPVQESLRKRLDISKRVSTSSECKKKKDQDLKERFQCQAQLSLQK